MKKTDKKNKLTRSPFSYLISGSLKVLINFEGRLIKTLSEKESSKFIARSAGKNEYEVQLELAKITGTSNMEMKNK